MYLWYVHNIKSKVLSACQNIKQFLTITGTPDEAYSLNSTTLNIQFIKTEHVEHIDCYGFCMNVNNKNIVYTGDTKTLKPFKPYIEKADELYVDVSKNGGVHLKFNDVKNELQNIQHNGTKVYLMHTDDKEYIRKRCDGEFEIK